MTLIVSRQRTMIMIHTNAENQYQTPVGSKNRIETDGRTDTTDCSTFPSNAVGNNDHLLSSQNSFIPV